MWNYSFLVFFFFSSRRRHTRFKCDWSSDVCSSDLVTVFIHPGRVDEDRDLLPRPMDADLGDPRLPIALLDELADLLVLDQKLREVLLAGVPGAQPIDHDPGAEPGRSNLLAHASPCIWFTQAA